MNYVTLFYAHVLISFVHIFLNVNKLCLNQDSAFEDVPLLVRPGNGISVMVDWVLKPSMYSCRPLL